MMKIQQYRARMLKGGKYVYGYAAIGTEGEHSFIMVPAAKDGKSFHIVEVDGTTFEEINDEDHV